MPDILGDEFDNPGIWIAADNWAKEHVLPEYRTMARMAFIDGHNYALRHRGKPAVVYFGPNDVNPSLALDLLKTAREALSANDVGWGGLIDDIDKAISQRPRGQED